MTTHERILRTWGTAGCTFALLTALLGTSRAAMPSTTAHQFSSHPMISGTVASVNDHRMVVNTDQGDQVALELDSRTMAPRDLAPGMVMRAEFRALEDCRFHAERIVPIRSGMSTDRLQAYANTRDHHDAMAGHMQHPGVHDPGAKPVFADQRSDTPQVMGEHSPGTVMTAAPATRDHVHSTRPMLSGRVVSVNDHRLVVDTEQGRRVGMAMDSRTLVPADLAPGSRLRVEFSQLEDRRYYANRVHIVGDGIAEREQAYAHSRDADVLLAESVPDCGPMGAARTNTVSSAAEPHEHAAMPAPVVMQVTPAADVPETLPQTASRQPLFVLLGLLALGSAGLASVVRMSRIG